MQEEGVATILMHLLQFPLVAMQMQLAITNICLHSISQTMQLYGIPSNATVSCRFGMKIPVRYECKGRSTIT